MFRAVSSGDVLELFLICLATFFAAALSAVAGGGTFIAFPAVTGIAHLSEKIATMTCTVGLWPRLVSAVVATRAESSRLPRRMIAGYSLTGLIGGAIGALLLARTSERHFHFAIPWLLLFATVVFGLSDRISTWAKIEAVDSRSPRGTLFIACMMFLLSIYGGYFGAGMGVLSIACLSLIGLSDLRQINALKMLIVTACNTTAVIIFALGAVRWNIAGPMMVSSTIGGYVGMATARRLPPRLLRAVILTSATLLTVAYFLKMYGR